MMGKELRGGLAMRKDYLLACRCAFGIVSAGLIAGTASAQTGANCSISAIPRWTVEEHRWSSGLPGILKSVDFAKGVTGGGAPLTVSQKATGVEFSFVSTGTQQASRTFSFDVTAQMRDGKCIMTGPGTMFPGKATTQITMVPR
jgi:hypothetical protein